MSLTFFLDGQNFIELTMFLGGAIMVFAFLLPYLIRPEDDSR